LTGRLVGSNLTIDLREWGQHAARCRRVLGEDHPDTLNSAHNLAADLSAVGHHEAARDLDEDTQA
jgi:hypothetical protein